MRQELQTHVAFHLTGRRFDPALAEFDPRELRPALLARYRDLAQLRYDYPLVLARDATGSECLQSLSAIVDGVLAEIMPKASDAERLQKILLRLEREMRMLLRAGASGTLSVLWEAAARRLGADTDELLEDSLGRARDALKVDGEVIDCNEEAPARVLTHAWRALQATKALKFRTMASRLAQKLAEILHADFINSDAGRSAENLRAAVGTIHADVFDFHEMSRLLTRRASRTPLPESRRRRIEWARSVLESQRFFPLDNAGHASRAEPYRFTFETCAAVLDAFRARRPAMVEVAKALAIAELEVNGQYVEGKHDEFFDTFSENELGPQDVALFPDYLACLRAGDMQALGYVELMTLLAAGLPVKVLVQTDDILEPLAIGNGHPAFGVRSAQLARLAVGLNDAFVMQAPASHLFQLRSQIIRGLACAAPALFSVYSGANEETAHLPAYLTAAAALEARAFPIFTYDPAGGPDWASRFSLNENPQVACDWPLRTFDYEDEHQQRVCEEIGFTFVDFAACDRRYAAHFAGVPRAAWSATVPIHRYLKEENKSEADAIPALLVVDGEDRLQKVLVDEKVVQEARRCREAWRSLRELSGVHHSHPEETLARQREAAQEPAQQMPETAAVTPKAGKAAAGAAAAPSAAPEAAAEAAAEAEKTSDDPYIETPRCTSCDECTQINNRMFAYDANKQAYIADVTAGTYRQLVEAAESCQVSIIHPGKPRNPNEPGLEELLQRAEPFL